MVAVGRDHIAPTPFRVQVVLGHEPAHLLCVHHQAAVAQLGVDAPIPIGGIFFGDRRDLGQYSPFVGRRRRSRIEAGTRDLHQLAPPFDGDAFGPVIADPGTFLGKAAFFTAPFRNSISSAWRPTSRSSAAMRASRS
jgi:hypothetical protein